MRSRRTFSFFACKSAASRSNRAIAGSTVIARHADGRRGVGAGDGLEAHVSGHRQQLIEEVDMAQILRSSRDAGRIQFLGAFRGVLGALRRSEDRRRLDGLLHSLSRARWQDFFLLDRQQGFGR